MTQLDLLGVAPSRVKLAPMKRDYFDGPGVTEADTVRLGKQIRDIRDLMLDGKARTLRQIADVTGYPEASVSAQLRHLRKPRFGRFIVDRERAGDGGTWLYQVKGTEK